jgi:hypothetical protein
MALVRVLVSINVWNMAGDTLNLTCNFLYCNHHVHRNIWSPCTYKLTPTLHHLLRLMEASAEQLSTEFGSYSGFTATIINTTHTKTHTTAQNCNSCFNKSPVKNSIHTHKSRRPFQRANYFSLQNILYEHHTGPYSGLFSRRFTTTFWRRNRRPKLHVVRRKDLTMAASVSSSWVRFCIETHDRPKTSKLHVLTIT